MSQAPLVRGFEVVIGLETHAKLSTASKIFSGASTRFGAAPNTQACAVDLALPGTLPVLHRGAVERAIVFGLAVQATVAPVSVFARKNYFYPDLPKGYQISQYEIPVVQGGQVEFLLEGQPRRVRLTRAGQAEVRRVMRLRARFLQQMVGGLPVADVAACLRVLEGISRNLGDSEPLPGTAPPRSGRSAPGGRRAGRG